MRGLFAACLVAALAAAAVAPDADGARKTVRTEAGFQKAVARAGSSGGIVTLRRGRYGTLVVRARQGRWLTVRGKPGVTVRRIVVRGSSRVKLQRIRVRGGQLNVYSSSQVVLDRVKIIRARVKLANSRRVTVRRSSFTRCGEFQACLYTGWSSWATSHVRVLNSRFYDCFGCDFIRGLARGSFVLRGSRLDRAVPGPCGAVWECNHQDGVQIAGGGGRVLIEGNRFGLTYQGAGQVYVAGSVKSLTIRNNIFVGTDPAHPDLNGWVAIVVGHHRADEARVPLGVRIVNNTILTGAERPGGIRNSVMLTPSYANLPVEARPVVANNVLGMTHNPERLCALAGVSSRNVTREGVACSEADAVADPGLDGRGQPVEGSILVDQADTVWTTRTDLRGWARDATPDIGAFEYGARR